VKHQSLTRKEAGNVSRLIWAVLPLSLLGLNATAVAQVATEDSGETYLLRYNLKSGEEIHYEVTHVAKTKTRIRGAEEISNVHTVSRRHWDVTSVGDEGMTFNHVIDAVEMTQQRGEEEEIRWSSEGEETPPAAFERVAQQIGDVISTLTVNGRGQEASREDNGATKTSLGMGSLTLALPAEPIAVGASWSVPREVMVRTPDGSPKPIKIRELYRLEKVKTGVATLSLRSEPLTPMDDESVRAQVIQQLSNGEIRFDVDNGRMLSKQLDWDETVVGFQGANSLMEYRARLTERLLDGVKRTAKRP
jgi:hypothetical protein